MVWCSSPLFRHCAGGRWEYRLPLFASDRSKWYEQISVWERDINWLVLKNNRYQHSILMDVYESGAITDI